MSLHSDLLQQLRDVTANPPTDVKECHELLTALRNAAFAVETPADTMFRVWFGMLEASVAKTIGDMGLIDFLAARDEPVGLEELSKQAGSDTRLTRRLLRFCTEHGLLDEPESKQYMPNARTKTMAMPGMQPGLGHLLEVQGPSWILLPKFLKSNGYKNIVDATDCPFQLAHNTKLSSFLWAASQGPELSQRSGKFFSGLRDISPNWLDSFPTQYLTSAASADDSGPVFIDVGGGMGHVCADLVRRLPELGQTRPIILQDLPHMTARFSKTPGVEARSYDFFTPQPIRNAPFYYIKQCLHDWPDDKAVDILKNQVPAMGEDSVILVDEVVLPERGASYRSVMYDISIMIVAAGGERTETEWAEIFHQAGLRVRETYYYDDEMFSAIQVLVKA